MPPGKETIWNRNRSFTILRNYPGIPRESGHTKEAADYCTAFAEAHGLSWRRDEYQNVVIRKPGSRGFEQAPTVMLQGHLDMVCVADPGVSHDFRTEGLHLKTDGDYLTADGTTLGGDDGIAVAMALAILDSEELIHPPLECVFTSDEEIGMIGASAMDMSDLKSSVLLNLDSEDEGVFLSGCAGGIRYDLTLPIERTEASGIPVRLHLSGLTGGHSGTDIVFGRANAVILAGEVLNRLAEEDSVSFPCVAFLPVFRTMPFRPPLRRSCWFQRGADRDRTGGAGYRGRPAGAVSRYRSGAFHDAYSE